MPRNKENVRVHKQRKAKVAKAAAGGTVEVDADKYWKEFWTKLDGLRKQYKHARKQRVQDGSDDKDHQKQQQQQQQEEPRMPPVHVSPSLDIPPLQPKRKRKTKKKSQRNSIAREAAKAQNTKKNRVVEKKRSPPTATAAAPTAPLSNVDRFFMEEAKRKDKQRKRESKRTRKEPQMESIKRMWKRMHMEVNESWKARPEPPPTARPRSSTDYANTHQFLSPGTLKSKFEFVSAEYMRMPSKELKKHLRVMNVNCSHCVDRLDLLAALNTTLRAQHEENERVRQEQTHERICAEVAQWRCNKSIRAMLNDINDTHKDNANTLHLSPTSKFDRVARAYKKALLKIHPDKHVGNHEDFVRATEMFKVVHAKWSEHKQLHTGTL